MPNVKIAVAAALLLAAGPALAQSGNISTNASANKPAASAAGEQSPSNSGGGMKTGKPMMKKHHRHNS